VKINEQRHGAVTVVEPGGPLVDEDAADFASRVSRLIGEQLGRVAIDASAVAYVDSAGLEALLEISDELADRGQTLKLCQVSETLREVLELTGVAGSVEQFADVNSAVRSFL